MSCPVMIWPLGRPYQTPQVLHANVEREVCQTPRVRECILDVPLKKSEGILEVLVSFGQQKIGQLDSLTMLKFSNDLFEIIIL